VEGLLCGVFLLMVIALPVVILAVVQPLQRKIGRLEQRTMDLHERLNAMELAPPSPEPAAPQTDRVSEDVGQADTPEPDASQGQDAPQEVETEEAAAPTSEVAPRPAKRPVRAPAGPALTLPSPEKIAVWLGASLGAIALVIGSMLGLVAVAEAGWFGPALRVSAGLMAGTAAWLVGVVLGRRWPVAGTGLSGAGIGTVFGAVFAATSMYDLVSPTVGFALLVAVVVAAMAQANRLHDRFLAWLAVVGGLLAPVLVSTGENGAVGLFSYLLLLTLGITAVARRRNWPELVAFIALGDAVLYVGWTASWLAVDSQRVALVAALALSVPFAAVAASRRAPMMLTGLFGASLMPLVVLPWVAAIDPVFHDPRTGETVVLAQSHPALSALMLLVLPIPLWIAARVRKSWWMSLLASALVVPAVLTWSGSWVNGSLESMPWLWIAPLLPLASGVVLHLGDRRTGWGLGPLPVVAGLALSGTLLAFPVGPAMVASLGALIALCAVAAWVAGPGAMLVAGLVGVLLPLHASILELDSLRPEPVMASALLALGVLATGALARRWSSDPWPPLPWVGGLVAPVALFLPMYAAWLEGVGDSVVGILPLCLAAWTLLGAVVLVRRHRVDRDGHLFALAIGVVLLGITFALPVQVESAWLTVGWALEGAALAWLATRLRNPLIPPAALVLGAVVGTRLLVNPEALSYGDSDGWPILNWTLYTWGIPTAALLLSARFLQRSPSGPVQQVGPAALRGMAMLTGFALVNVEVSHAFQDAGPVELGGNTMLQGMVRSLSWGGYGMSLLAVGILRNSRSVRFAGFAFLLLAAAKVFVYDMWSLPGFVRVGSLLGLGFILLVAAFLFERLVLRPDADEGAS
jgi:uncharacterized membrane protein